MLDYLDDILVAIEKIERFTDGMDYEEFVADDKTVDAVLRNFEVIGEATKNIPAEVRHKYSDVRGLRWLECAIS